MNDCNTARSNLGEGRVESQSLLGCSVGCDVELTGCMLRFTPIEIFASLSNVTALTTGCAWDENLDERREIALRSRFAGPGPGIGLDDELGPEL